MESGGVGKRVKNISLSAFTSKNTCSNYFLTQCTIGAYGPDTERIKVHCFFKKTIGTVPVFVGSVPFLLCRVNAPSDRYSFPLLSLLDESG